MIIKRIATLVGLCLLTLSFNSHAQGSRTFGDVYSQCGLGAMLFNQSGNPTESGRVLAIISNVTWDLGTTAHSSNLSSEDNCVGESTTTAAFILNNGPRIESDVARGEGEYLAAMISTMKCTAPGNDIVSGLRSDLTMSLTSDTRSSDPVKNAAVLYDSLALHCHV